MSIKKFNETDVISGLNRIFSHSESIVLIHSALNRLPVRMEQCKTQLLNCLSSWSSQGKTILIPTFTFEFTKTGIFNKDIKNAEVGVLGNWVLDLDISSRTSHPIYSFAVLGPLKEQILTCDTHECFGVGSALNYIFESRVTILMLGAGWESCTLFHCLEEKAEVPYRYMKTFEGEIIKGGSKEEISTRMFVRDETLGVKNKFSVLIDNLEDNIFKSPEFPYCQSINGSSLKEIGTRMFSEDPLCCIEDQQRVSWLLDIKRERAKHETIRVFFYGSDNNEFISKNLDELLSSCNLPRDFQVECPPYGQQKSFFLKNKLIPNYVIVVERLHSVVSKIKDFDNKEEKLFFLLQLFIEEIEMLASNKSTTVMVHAFMPPTMSESIEIEVNIGINIATIISKANNFLNEQLCKYENIRIIYSESSSFSIDRPGVGERLYQLSKNPYGPRQISFFSRIYAKKIIQHLGLSVRLLICDLDNTIWGGIVGEDDISGIQLGGDAPGSGYKKFQLTLKLLSKKGIALGICSKNDEATVAETFKSHAEMVLELKDFTAKRINWVDKSSNISDIANEIGISFSSIGFIDDNPIENERVRNQCPGVRVIDIGTDPALFSDRLLESPFIGHDILSPEDLKRSDNYRARSNYLSSRRQTESLDQFLRDLNVKIFIQDLTKYNKSRAVQLINKTNQFNSTCVRYSEYQISNDFDEVLIVGASDKFHERENIGVIAIKFNKELGESQVKLFLLSCRALGKGIENELMIWLSKNQKKIGIRKIRWDFLENPRNNIVRELYQSFGCEENNQFLINTSSEFLNSENQFISVFDERSNFIGKRDYV